jgi:hypothetical protein
VLPNFVAYAALCAWPLVCVVLFVVLPVESAAIWSLLGGYLLLPSGVSFDPHVLPPLDKFSIPSLATFLLCWMKGTPSPPSRAPWLVYMFAFAFMISPIFTAYDNSYELRIGDRSIPGFYPIDGLKMVGHNLVDLTPFFVGTRFLSSDRGRALLLKALPTAALFYSLPMLFELRMSPQLERIVYGVGPVFAHLVRAGGYRPAVFLSTGLELALFTSMAFIAAVVIVRTKWRLLHAPAGAAATYLGCLLLLCKSFGTIVFGMLAMPLLIFTAPRTWVRIACAAALIICAYPMLRSYDLIPVHRVVAATNTVNAERGGSLEFRIENEDRLLAKAEEKPFFGWGTWGRNRVFDQGTGSDVSITDGEWVLRFGMYGWFGYLSLFGLFAAAMLGALAGAKGAITSSTIVVGGLTLILAVNLIDLIPNANLLPLTYLLAGSVAGGLRSRVNARAVQRSSRSPQTMELAEKAVRLPW